MKTLFIIIALMVFANAKAQEIPNLTKKNGKYALVNQNNQVISAYYDAILDFKLGIAQVRNAAKLGFINKQGKIVIAVKYDQYQIKNEYNNYLIKYIKENPNNKELIEYFKIEEQNKRIKEADEYYDNKKYENTISSYTAILKTTKGDFNIYKKLALSYNATEKYDSAIVYFNKALSLKENANLTYTLAFAYANAGSYEQSLNNFDKLMTDYPVDAKKGKASTYHKMDKHKKAYNLQKELSVLSPKYYDIWFNLSFYALFVKKPQEAIEAAKKTLELNPEATGVYANLALAYVLNNEFTKAKPIYLKWKDKHFPDDKHFCKEVFLQAIKNLKAAGIKHKNFKKVRELLE